MDHHWMENSDFDGEGDPEYECKHCPATCHAVDAANGFSVPDNIVRSDIDHRREHLGARRIIGPAACAEVLLVGEMNPYGADERYALYHEPKRAAGYRLQSVILGLRPREHYLPLWRVNLCAGSWSTQDGAERAAELITQDAPWSVLIMLGSKVAEAFRIAHGGRPKPYECESSICPGGPPITFVALPHPSGRVTSWNDPANVERARRVLREVAPRVPWGEV